MFDPTVRVAVPDPPVRVVGVIEVVNPGVPVEDREMVPANWFRLVIVIVEVPVEPELTGPGTVGTIPKSRKWNSAAALWTREPAVPVIVKV